MSFYCFCSIISYKRITKMFSKIIKLKSNQHIKLKINTEMFLQADFGVKINKYYQQ